MVEERQSTSLSSSPLQRTLLRNIGPEPAGTPLVRAVIPNFYRENDMFSVGLME